MGGLNDHIDALAHHLLKEVNRSPFTADLLFFSLRENTQYEMLLDHIFFLFHYSKQKHKIQLAFHAKDK